MVLSYSARGLFTCNYGMASFPLWDGCQLALAFMGLLVLSCGCHAAIKTVSNRWVAKGAETDSCLSHTQTHICMCTHIHTHKHTVEPLAGGDGKAYDIGKT